MSFRSSGSNFLPSYGGGAAFPNPFLDLTSSVMPESMPTAFNWCEVIWNRLGVWRAAMDRVISYFLTDFELEGLDHAEKKKQLEFYYDALGLRSHLKISLGNLLCYGNEFTSIISKFHWMLYCPRKGCGLSLSFKEATDPSRRGHYKFRWQDYKIFLRCPRCDYDGAWEAAEFPDDDPSALLLRHWNPKEIFLKHDWYSDQCQIFWRIPETYKRDIRRGDVFSLSFAPSSVLDAVKNNQMYRFHPEGVYHMKHPHLAGMVQRGWGIPFTLINLGDAWYVQMLRRNNEICALDFVHPIRFVTPMYRGGSGVAGGMASDPLYQFGGDQFVGEVGRAIRQSRRIPTSWHVLPFPIQAMTLSGDGKNFFTPEMLNQGIETMMLSANVPVELFNGSLTMQTMPVALRLFEAVWQHMVHDANRWLDWVNRTVTRTLGWETGKLRLAKPTLADNAERQMMLLQLMTGGVIPQSTALRGLGLDWMDQQEGLTEEARISAKLQERLQEEAEKSHIGRQISRGVPAESILGPPPQGGPGGAPAGGPGGPGPAAPGMSPVDIMGMLPAPNEPMTPDDAMALASAIAEELLRMPDLERRRQLRVVRENHPSIHAQVLEIMKQRRSEARSQGQQMVMQQQYGV